MNHAQITKEIQAMNFSQLNVSHEIVWGLNRIGLFIERYGETVFRLRLDNDKAELKEALLMIKEVDKQELTLNDDVAYALSVAF